MIGLILSMKKLNESMLKNFIVTVELVNYTNVFKEKGNTGRIKVTKMFNQLNRKMKGFNRELEVPEEESIAKKTEELLLELSDLNKDELLVRLIMSLEERLENVYKLSEKNYTLQDLEEAMIDSASKTYKINPDISTEDKIKLIKVSVEKEMIELSLKYQEMSKSEQEEMNQAINREIEGLSPEEAEDLKNHLNVEQLSGDAISDLLIQSGGALSLMLIPSLAGFSSYIALTTIMHAVFTTTLGITLPFAAYTGATSFVSILAGPVGWIGVSGLTAYNLGRNRNKMTQTIMAQIVGITAILSESMEDSMVDLPSWLSDHKRAELFTLKEKLAAEQDKLKELTAERDQLNQIREEAKLHTESLEAEVNELDSVIKSYDESNAAFKYLMSTLEDKEAQLKHYREANQRAAELGRELNITSENVRGYAELIAQTLMPNQLKDQKGHMGELKVFTRLIEYLPRTYTFVGQPFIGEGSPDILLIHPEYGFRILEVKNNQLGSIRQIESNGGLGIQAGGDQTRWQNPLKQVNGHVEQFYRYLANNHQDLGDQYRNIGQAVVHVDFTKDEFYQKFHRTIDRWDDQTISEYFKYHIFADEINSRALDRKIQKAKKFSDHFKPISKEKMNEISSSIVGEH